MTLIDLNPIFPIKPELQTAENFWNCYNAEKRIVSKLSKLSITNFIAQIEDLNQDCVEISCSICDTLQEMSRLNSKGVTVRPGRFIIHRWFLILKWSWKYLSIFSDFCLKIVICLNVIEQLLIGNSFTRKYVVVFLWL